MELHQRTRPQFLQVKEGFQVPSFLGLFQKYGIRTDKEYGG
jgi:hypothetical protein